MRKVFTLALVVVLLAITGCPPQTQMAENVPQVDSDKDVNYKDKTRIRISQDFDLLERPYRPGGQDPFERILVQGDVDASRVSYYIEPLAKTSGGKNTRGEIKWFRATYLPIVGTDDDPVVGHPIIWEGMVSYDTQNRPTVVDTGNANRPDAGQFLVGAAVWLAWRTINCTLINLTIGLPVCLPTLKAGEKDFSNLEEFSLAVEDFSAGKLKTKPFRGWLELLPNSHDLCEITWEVMAEYKVKSLPRETQFNSGHFDFDFDGDGFTNRHEIETGYDPYDPNDHPGGPTLASVPNVVGLQLVVAGLVIYNAGLEIGNIGYAYNQASAGTVIGQGPAPGSSVPLGSDVDLTISLGPQSSPLSASIVLPANNTIFDDGEPIGLKVNIVGGKAPYQIHVLYPDGIVKDYTVTMAGEASFTHSISLPNPPAPGAYSTGNIYVQVSDDNGVQYPAPPAAPLSVTIRVLGPPIAIP